MQRQGGEHMFLIFSSDLHYSIKNFPKYIQQKYVFFCLKLGGENLKRPTETFTGYEDIHR